MPLDPAKLKAVRDAEAALVAALANLGADIPFHTVSLAPDARSAFFNIAGKVVEWKLEGTGPKTG